MTHPSLKRWLSIAGLLSVVAAATVACTPSHPQSTFDAAGDIAEGQRTLFYIIFWVAVAVFVLVEGALVYAAVRFRRKPGQGVPAQVHGNQKLEIAWTIVPTLVLAVIAVPTVRDIFYNAHAPQDTMEITVVGHRWWWEFQYPELDPTVVTANELHIPLNRPVNLTLTSNEVNHSFWVPKLAGKVDVIPTRENTLWFVARREGIYYGQCAEFCGIAHANMRFRVVAESQEKFDAWVAGYRTLPAVLEPGSVEAQGQALFFGRGGCIACHTTDGPPKFAQIGPNLTKFGARTTMAAGIRENTTENLTAWLRDPSKVKPGNLMAGLAPIYTIPNLALGEEDVAALVAYLHSLR